MSLLHRSRSGTVVDQLVFKMIVYILLAAVETSWWDFCLSNVRKSSLRSITLLLGTTIPPDERIKSQLMSLKNSSCLGEHRTMSS
jgi:hypothetical protein